MIKLSNSSISVDNPEDLKKVEQILNNKDYDEKFA